MYGVSLFCVALFAFKRCLQDFFYISTYEKRYDYALDRYSSILHTRLRLNCCALNYHLFKINCVTSPACDCGFNCESVIHYFLYCPRYTLRTSLLAAMVEILGSGCYYKSDTFKTKMFLFGSEKLTVDQNNAIFFHVQSYIKGQGIFQFVVIDDPAVCFFSPNFTILIYVSYYK